MGVGLHAGTRGTTGSRPPSDPRGAVQTGASSGDTVGPRAPATGRRSAALDVPVPGLSRRQDRRASMIADLFSPRRARGATTIATRSCPPDGRDIYIYFQRGGRKKKRAYLSLIATVPASLNNPASSPLLFASWIPLFPLKSRVHYSKPYSLFEISEKGEQALAP